MITSLFLLSIGIFILIKGSDFFVDGATSIAEAISVAINKTKRDEVVISSGLNPNSKEVINTLIDRNKFNLDYVDLDNFLFPNNPEPIFENDLAKARSA